MRRLLVILSLASAGSVSAQHAGHQHAGHQHASDYAGMQARDIKALSSEQVADLREGRGMGASLPAELNGVPGPMHVLQLAQQLRISPEQQTALERISADMKTSAQRLGSQVIAAEADLDNAFKSGAIDEKGIAESTTRIAHLQGQLRAVHLTAHLETRRLLSTDQVAAYNQARGYATGHAHKH
jgi:hypothetical protein